MNCYNMRRHDLYELPVHLKGPQDDGEARHLIGLAWPPSLRSSTSGWFMWMAIRFLSRSSIAIPGRNAPTEGRSAGLRIGPIVPGARGDCDRPDPHANSDPDGYTSDADRHSYTIGYRHLRARLVGWFRFPVYQGPWARRLLSCEYNSVTNTWPAKVATYSENHVTNRAYGTLTVTGTSPFGGGHAASRFVDIFAQVLLSDRLLGFPRVWRVGA